MCGIAGGFWPEKPAALADRLQLALHALRRRGPDDSGRGFASLPHGTLALGHTRLSVIDLSAAGRQPMRSADGRFTLVFNGEIYNYLELRDELSARGATFRTATDTEVLLQAWGLWGREALSRFTGMFAFAVHDRQENTLTCARDAFGIKPLYYANSGKTFCFASELGAIRLLLQAPPRLNWQRAYDYLAHGDYEAGDDSFVAGVQQLSPGHLLRLELDQGTTVRTPWWKPTVVTGAPLRFEEAAESLREKFLASIALHLRSDVPVGVALSGGLDSAAIACAVNHLHPRAPLHTFSFIADSDHLSEEVWIDRIVTHTHATAHKIRIDPSELARDLDDLIATQGEPFGSTSIYAQYRVFQLAKEQGVTVTLDGQGGDELLGGYNGFPGSRIRSLLDRHHYAEALNFLRHWSRWPGRSTMQGIVATVAECTEGPMHDRLRRIVGAPLKPAWLNAGVLQDGGVLMRYPQHRPLPPSPGRRMAAALANSATHHGLPALLRHGDRNSMRFSVESRVPFLTQALADFLWALPEQYLVSPTGETKSLLRAALRGIVPDAILDRRDKIGFATPERQWLYQIAPQAREWLREETGLPFLDQRRIVEAFDAMLTQRRPFSWQAWRWINFIRWYNRHMKV